MSLPGGRRPNSMSGRSAAACRPSCGQSRPRRSGVEYTRWLGSAGVSRCRHTAFGMLNCGASSRRGPRCSSLNVLARDPREALGSAGAAGGAKAEIHQRMTGRQAAAVSDGRTWGFSPGRSDSGRSRASSGACRLVLGASPGVARPSRSAPPGRRASRPSRCAGSLRSRLAPRHPREL